LFVKGVLHFTPFIFKKAISTNNKTTKTMKAKSIILLLILQTIISCTTKKETAITNQSDYQVYLKDTENVKLKNTNTDIVFWQTKFDKANNQEAYLSKLASLYSHRFEITGNITDLYKAEELLLKVDKKLIGESANTKRSIAKNYISQHRFKEALNYINEAFALGENKAASKLMFFDVYMELGDYTKAQKFLNEMTDFNDFDYLIRLAKYQDHLGNLPKTIQLMEKAMKIAENKKNEGLTLWAYTNIADFYGHNNQIEKSYQYYLKALQLDNHNYYSLKGIAWIAFSHERNPDKAQQIIDYIVTKHNVPDLYLIKSEIADFKGDQKASEKALSQYNKLLSQHNYGEMYNKYNFNLWIENATTLESAQKIAEREVQNRPTPESYDLLAWSYFKKGETKKALEIAQLFTINKSFEPHINYHNSEILKANGQLIQKEIKAELLSSVYELGPAYEYKIKNL
jgi:tetratricopeptide (TPR) repeat protein